MSTSTEKKITLKSSDGETFVVDKKVALMAQTIKHLMDEIDEDLILLPNVTGVILAKVIEYCNKHVKDNETDFSKDLRAWDTNFVEVEQSTLFDLIMAANYLDIKSLLDLTCKTVADMFKGKSTKEIRKTFNIKNDYTPEEEAEIRKELHWAFE